MPNHLTKITDRARQLKRKHPTAKWTNLIKQAARELRGKKSAPKRKVATSKPKKRKRGRVGASKLTEVRHVARVGDFRLNGALSGASVSVHMRHAKDKLMQELGSLETRKFVAKRKADKKKLQKKITAVKARIRKLS